MSKYNLGKTNLMSFVCDSNNNLKKNNNVYTITVNEESISTPAQGPRNI